MKKYKEYMDGVTVSDTLHEKLKHLEEPKKRPQAWQKYGAAAAALVLVLGLGAWGMSRMDGSEAGREVADGPVSSAPAIGESGIIEPAIEPAPAPMPNSPGMETIGGYEVNHGETVAYYMLPAIHYGEVENEMQADLALPLGVTRRDLTEEEIDALFGGKDNLETHLNWGGYDLYAHAFVWPDGTFWMLSINGIRGDTGLEHFDLEVAPGSIPPTCVVYGESVTNNIWEREVMAESHDGAVASTRRVSFMDGGYGYRFEITGTDTDAIEELVSRAVRWIIVGDGLLLNQNLDVPADAPVDGGMTTEPYDPGYSVGEPNFEDGANTSAYDPSASPTPTADVESAETKTPAPPEP